MLGYRSVAPLSLRVYSIEPPFSNFDFIERNYGSVSSIHRLFSQARGYACRTLVVESIPPVGVLKEDDDELHALFSDFVTGGVQRLTFWHRAFHNLADLLSLTSKDLIGYAILKCDVVSSRKRESWYVFESVMRKYPHVHNCVPGEARFHLRVADKKLSVPGVLYCQQNGLNKACAQVALRSLLMTREPRSELSYRRINDLAVDGDNKADPGEGLTVPQMRAVLRGLDISFFDIDYSRMSIDDRHRLAYQKVVYSGVESGAGALLGFRFSGPGASGEERHIVPFFGHTFNQDTWVPNAEVAYFHVGEKTRYLPSETWTSSFIGHDDNFGSNFCVPRLYVTPSQAEYVLELLPENVLYSGVVAEAIAVDYLYSIVPEIERVNLPWLDRLLAAIGTQQVVLRAVNLEREQYFKHWRALRDWEGNTEKNGLCEVVNRFLPKQLWMIEISVPELFPANLRKVGEIVLSAMSQPTSKRNFAQFVHARIPGRLLFLKAVAPDGRPSFVAVESQLQSHTPLYRSSC